VFVAAIVLHLCRIFFTGAFRRPRQRTWVVGIAVLLLAMAQGLAGHSLPDDLLSGMSLQVVWSAVLAIPVIGPEVAYLLFGGEFPSPETIPRLFVLHTMLLPALLVGLVAVHLGTVVPRRRQRDPRPARAFASTSLLLLVAAVLGPTTRPTSPPRRSRTALLLPAVAFGILTLWPGIERRLGGDRAEHQLLDRPRDAPLRSAVGAAGLTMFLVTWPVCPSLRRSGLPPAGSATGPRLERTASGGYRTVRLTRAGADQPGPGGEHHQPDAVAGGELDHGARRPGSRRPEFRRLRTKSGRLIPVMALSRVREVVARELPGL
jgi:hypothetical protein